MIAILYNIRSLHNVGSIFRTADAAGFEKIYLCGITPSPYDIFGKPRQSLIKVSLGAEKYLKWEKIGPAKLALAARITANLLKNLKKEGYEILAIEQSKNSVPYFQYMRSKTTNTSESTNRFQAANLSKPKSQKQKKKQALIVGNEIKGLPPSILKMADKTLEIPMFGKKESLNVSVAFGIVAFSLIN